MKPFNRVNEADLAFFESLLPGRVFSGEAISTDYDHDEMTIYGHYAPEAVLQAQSTEEISAVLRYCNGRNIAVTPRGAGTGLCGGCVATEGGVVLSTERMKRVLEVDTRNMTATVEPGVLLFDEPLSNLDAKLRNQMRSEIIKLRQKINTTFIYVTHDQTEAMTLGDRIVIMRDGFIQQIGTPQEVFDHPANLFVAGFIGTPQMNFFDARLGRDADGYYVDVCGARIVPSADKQAALAAAGAVPQNVTLGIRPDHIVLCGDGAPGAIPAQVDVTELMGSTIHMHVTIQGRDAIVILPTIDLSREQRTSFTFGAQIHVTFGGNLVHLFSRETEKNLI